MLEPPKLYPPFGGLPWDPYNIGINFLMQEFYLNHIKKFGEKMKPKYKEGQTAKLTGGEEVKITRVLSYLHDDCWYEFSFGPDSTVTISESKITGPVYKVGDRVRIKTHDELMADDKVFQVKAQTYVQQTGILAGQDMVGLLGKEVTIKNLYVDGSFRISEADWTWEQWMIAEWMGTETSAPCPKCSQLSFRSGSGEIACEKCKTIFEPPTKQTKKEDEMKYKIGDTVIIKPWSEIKDHYILRNKQEYKECIEKVYAGKEVEIKEIWESTYDRPAYSVRPSYKDKILYEDFIQGLASDLETKEGWYFSTTEKKLSHGDGRDIEPGVTHSVKGDIQVCRRGLHMFPTLDTDIYNNLNYGAAEELILWRVEGSGDFASDTKGIKYVYRNRKYLWGVHVKGWGLRDYQALNDMNTIKKVEAYFSILVNLPTYEIFQETETIEVPYFEGFKCLGYRKAEVGDWIFMNEEEPEKSLYKTNSRWPIYEKLAPPKPKVKFGQVWEVDGKEFIILRAVEDKALLTYLPSITQGISVDKYGLDADSIEGVKNYLYLQDGELIAQSLEEYYQDK